MARIRRAAKSKAQAFFADARCHPQVIAVLRTRAKWMGIPLIVDDASRLDAKEIFGAHIQYPDTYGGLMDWSEFITRVHASGGLVSMGTDPLALVLLKSPGALGADVAVGSAQRFGVPLGYGGPHAGYMACRAELVRQMPGRIIGVSVDAAGRTAYRMALQTREQHIRREKATHNITTAQTLNALAGIVYLSWLGKQGLVELGDLLLHRTAYARRALAALDGVELLHEQPVVREFALRHADEYPLNEGRIVSSKGIDIAAAQARRHGDLADIAREDLAALGIGGRLLVLDRRPFAVSGHGLILCLSGWRLGTGCKPTWPQPRRQG